MAINFTQTDATFAACDATEDAACSGRSISAATNSDRECLDGGTAGTTNFSWGLASSETNTVIAAFCCTVAAGVTWAAGTWTVRFNVTTANMNLTVTEIYICRANSACTNQETIGSATGLSISLGSTGVKSQAVTGSAVTPSVGDIVVVTFVATNGAMSNQSAQITPNQNIDSPFTAAASFSGTVASTNPALTSSFTGIQLKAISGSIAATDPAMTSAFTGTQLLAISGTIASSDPALTSEFTGKQFVPISGSFDSTGAALTAEFTGTQNQTFSGTIGSSLPAMLSEFTGIQLLAISGTAAATMPALTDDWAGDVVAPAANITGTVDSSLPALTMAADGTIVAVDVAAVIASAGHGHRQDNVFLEFYERLYEREEKAKKESEEAWERLQKTVAEAYAQAQGPQKAAERLESFVEDEVDDPQEISDWRGVLLERAERLIKLLVAAQARKVRDQIEASIRTQYETALRARAEYEKALAERRRIAAREDDDAITIAHFLTTI